MISEWRGNRIRIKESEMPSESGSGRRQYLGKETVGSLESAGQRKQGGF